MQKSGTPYLLASYLSSRYTVRNAFRSHLRVIIVRPDRAVQILQNAPHLINLPLLFQRLHKASVSVDWRNCPVGSLQRESRYLLCFSVNFLA